MGLNLGSIRTLRRPITVLSLSGTIGEYLASAVLLAIAVHASFTLALRLTCGLGGALGRPCFRPRPIFDHIFAGTGEELDLCLARPVGTSLLNSGRR